MEGEPNQLCTIQFDQPAHAKLAKSRGKYVKNPATNNVNQIQMFWNHDTNTPTTARDGGGGSATGTTTQAAAAGTIVY